MSAAPGPSLHVRELSARGRGAISVLELTGDGALERLATLTPARRWRAGEFGCVALRDARGELLDEALVLVDSPARVELHLHGAPALVARVARELGALPCAESQLALEERALALLAAAPGEAAARTLLDQSEGALRRALCELLELQGEAFRAAALELAGRGRVARRLLEPPRVVLAGEVNAGKSTLFNALVGRERVVVDEAAGTTRDAVRERVVLGAYAVDLFDTAGERALTMGAEHEVERAGQVLAAELRNAADLVLWLVPPGAPPPTPRPRQVLVRSQADRLTRTDPELPVLSALEAPARARELVVELVLDALDLPREPWTPGAAVPFEPEWIERLAAAPRVARDELARAVRTWLE